MLGSNARCTMHMQGVICGESGARIYLIGMICVRHGHDSELNHESTQNQMFLAWVMNQIESIPGDPLQSWVDSESIPWKAVWVMSPSKSIRGDPLESWVDLSQFLESRLSHEWNRFNSPRYCLSHEMIRTNFSGRHVSRRPKKGHTKSGPMVVILKVTISSEMNWAKAQKDHSKYWIKSIMESWVESHQYFRKIFESWVDLNQISDNHYESWVDLNEFLKANVSHELSQDKNCLRPIWIGSKKSNRKIESKKWVEKMAHVWPV